MLGRPYTLCGHRYARARVWAGNSAFPPPIWMWPALLVPPAGVYAADAQFGAGDTHRAAVNIGHRPTVRPPPRNSRSRRTCLDFDRDIYGQEMELTFLKKLRDEQKFPSADALRAQIAQDVAQARNFTAA